MMRAAAMLLFCLALPAQRGSGPASDLKIAARFDADGDGRLDAGERAAARAWLTENRPAQRGPRGRGPGGMSGTGTVPDQTGRQVQAGEVPAFPGRELYDPEILRTLFLEFEAQDWFVECAAFYRTDVEVPARLIVDGREYPDVGVGFRGNSSYFAAPTRKKSFALSLDSVHGKQRLYGYRTLNLLNAHADPSFLREAMHAFIVRRFTPAMQANLVHLVVDGESYGIYASVQQWNGDFLAREFGTRGGVRWKAPAMGRGGGLQYLGPDRADYAGAYQLKSTEKDEAAAWDRLLHLCRVLHETPDELLEVELPDVLDIDAALWFLAADTVLLDGDGYTSRASDFVLWESPDHRFRPLPYDSNEILAAGPAGPGPGMGPRGVPPGAFPPQGSPPGGAGGMFGRGPGGMRPASPTSGPLLLLETDARPLARLLEVPSWRARFLAHVRTLAMEGLDWSVLGPFCTRLHEAIDPIVREDGKALHGYAAFARSLADIERIVAVRRAALLEHPDLRGPWPEITAVETERAETDAGPQVRVRARVTAEMPLATVLLWVARSPYGPFVAHRMQDGGGGAWTATVEIRPKDRELRYYVEARAAAPACRTAFAPAAAGGRPALLALAPR